MSDNSKHAKIEWDDELKAVVVQCHWKLAKKYLLKGLTSSKKMVGNIWIADQYNSERYFSKAIVDFIEASKDAAVANGIKKILTILPKSDNLAVMNTKLWNTKVAKNDQFQMLEFPDMVSCKKWILEN